MKFMEKVASYLEAYTASEAKDSLLKVASEDGVTTDDLIAYHNLTEGNIFTGENLIAIESNPEESTSKLIQLGNTIDKVASEGLDESIIFKTAEELGLDNEDVAFYLTALQKQAEEAGLAPQANAPSENVVNAVNLLKEAGLDPVEAITVALNVDEDGNVSDEKVAAVIANYTDEDLDKIAEAMEMIGEITPAVAEEILGLANA